MKRLILTLTLVLAVGAGAANAQPLDPDCFVGVHFENNLGAMAYACTTGIDSLFIFAESVDDFFYSWEFMVDYPLCFTVLGETYATGVSLTNGDTQNGVQLGFSVPQNGFFPGNNILVKVIFLCSCSSTDLLLRVMPHPVSGLLQYADDSPDRTAYECIGLTSVINPSTIAIEETSWGKIKKLFTASE